MFQAHIVSVNDALRVLLLDGDVAAVWLYCECVRMTDVGDDAAVNCFPAAVLMGLHGHGFSLPPEVGKYFNMDARHQAFREVLLRQAEQAWRLEGDGDMKLTFQRMIESLQNGRLVWEDVSMFIVELLRGMVTVNVIFGVTSMGALTVSSYALQDASQHLMLLSLKRRQQLAACGRRLSPCKLL